MTGDASHDAELAVVGGIIDNLRGLIEWAEGVNKRLDVLESLLSSDGSDADLMTRAEVRRMLNEAGVLHSVRAEP